MSKQVGGRPQGETKRRISLFQIQHIRDVEHNGKWNSFILAEQASRPNPFTDTITGVPAPLTARKREFYPFQLNVDRQIYEVWCETSNSCLPELMCKIINLKMSEYVQKTINNLESAMIRGENNGKFLSDWYCEMRSLLVDLSGDSPK